MTRYVLDANVLIHGTGDLPNGTYFTTPLVRQELKSQSAQHTLTALDITTHTPGQDAEETVNNQLERHAATVEDADKELLALALDENATILTDDYALQNACQYVSVDYEPYLDDGIDQHRATTHVCTTCGATLPPEKDRCSCGGTPTPRTTPP